ncbi:hypothetical protein [Brucella vulpis]|uniref:hypothetical protein n=1 Tax=Brucella vulpis TaxID=981386 RepID=UPI000A78C8B4
MTELTFEDLRDMSARVGNMLADAGISAGDVVAGLLPARLNSSLLFSVPGASAQSISRFSPPSAPKPSNSVSAPEAPNSSSPIWPIAPN